MPKQALNHCQQIQELEALYKGFFSSKFDNIINLNKEVAKITAKHFYDNVIQPRLELLKDTGQRMEDGLVIRKAIMENSNDYLEFTDLKGKKTIILGKENLEEYYQKEKPNLKKRLIKKNG